MWYCLLGYLLGVYNLGQILLIFYYLKSSHIDVKEMSLWRKVGAVLLWPPLAIYSLMTGGYKGYFKGV